MAILKNITNERGVISTYFRVRAVITRYDVDPPQMVVQMAGYADETYRLKEKNNDVPNREFDFSNSYIEKMLPVAEDEAISRPTVYSRLKTEVAEFDGAVDVLEPVKETVDPVKTTDTISESEGTV